MPDTTEMRLASIILNVVIYFVTFWLAYSVIKSAVCNGVYNAMALRDAKKLKADQGSKPQSTR